MNKQKRLRDIVTKELLIIFLSAVIGLIITLLITKAYSDTTSDNLSRKFIRLHVLANSNLESDQLLKIKVRDGVMAMLSERVSRNDNIVNAREAIVSSIEDIKRTAENIIADEGYNYKADVSLRRTSFPTKHYGDFVLVAGVYEALRIEIGGAKGDNWWCVVYPPLCFVDVATGKNALTAEEVDKTLKNDLTEGEYRLVAENDSLPVKIKFKAVEIWQKHKHAIETRKEMAKNKDNETVDFDIYYKP